METFLLPSVINPNHKKKKKKKEEIIEKISKCKHKVRQRCQIASQSDSQAVRQSESQPIRPKMSDKLAIKQNLKPLRCWPGLLLDTIPFLIDIYDALSFRIYNKSCLWLSRQFQLQQSEREEERQKLSLASYQ